MSQPSFIEPPVIPVEPKTEETRRFSLSEDWLAVVLGLALLGFTFLSLVKVPW